MTGLEMMEKVNKIYEDNKDQYDYIGLRYENKSREAGDICECSKNNIDRADERDFPVYGTDEYSETPSFNGTSAWDLRQKETRKVNQFYADRDCTGASGTDHCYIVVGNEISNMDDGLDYNEIVIVDAKVLAVIY